LFDELHLPSVSFGQCARKDETIVSSNRKTPIAVELQRLDFEGQTWFDWLFHYSNERHLALAAVSLSSTIISCSRILKPSFRQRVPPWAMPVADSAMHASPGQHAALLASSTSPAIPERYSSYA
jgi:hypothetical protein